MLRIKPFLLMSFLCCVLTACDANIAVNKEPVFNNYKPENKEYRSKLAEKLKVNPEELVYVFQKYIDNGTIEIIVSGKDFAANCLVKVNDWKGMEGIKEAKGGGYRYAELNGLQLDIQETPEGEIFIYKGINYIID